MRSTHERLTALLRRHARPIALAIEVGLRTLDAPDLADRMRVEHRKGDEGWSKKGGKGWVIESGYGIVVREDKRSVEHWLAGSVWDAELELRRLATWGQASATDAR